MANSNRIKSQQIMLPDGRELGYIIFGNPEGKPIIYNHGWPSSRLEASGLDQTARDLDVQIIAIDRPGIGLSDYKINRTIKDWPRDVEYLAKILEIEKFSVLGVSSGGPYAMACASAIPDRILAVGLVGAVGPYNSNTENFIYQDERDIISLAKTIPWLARYFITKTIRQIDKNPEKSFIDFTKKMSSIDKKIFENYPEGKQWLLDMVKESGRSGSKGLVKDISLEGKPWGFKLEDIQSEVYLWHGDDDEIIFPGMGQYLDEKIPNCKSTFLKGEGHVSLLFNHGREVFQTIIS